MIDRTVVNRARRIERFLSQPFFVAEVFTRITGQYITLEAAVVGFNRIVSGKCDSMAEGLLTNDIFIAIPYQQASVSSTHCPIHGTTLVPVLICAKSRWEHSWQVENGGRRPYQ